MDTPNPEFPGYRVITRIHDGGDSAAYRGVRIRDGQPVVLKLLKPTQVTPMGLSRFHNEYEVSRLLKTDRILKISSLETLGQTLFLVLEDFGGIRLDFLLKQWGQVGSESFPLSKFLDVAIQIVQSLADIHAAGVIHKDLYTFSVVLNPHTGQFKIGNFDIATILSRESPALTRSLSVRGPLAYMSPEQTGRMNRTIDYRTDFYSLGAVFYEMLTGRLPFEAKDAMELVHLHLAKTPVAPCVLNPTIPRAVSDLVMKLLAKTPEDRYQSAGGIERDLELCLQRLQADGKILDFELARHDRADRFLIPEKLYGREAEVAILLAAFERAAQGKAEMLLVSGYAGIGKTAVIHEVHKPIVERHGHFIKGGFDQFRHNLRYSAFVEALRDLMGQLFTESIEREGQWRTRILNALGENGQAIIEVIPELEQIIGTQLPAPELSGIAAQNRYNLLFQKLINALATPEHPLVIFLDDLQWADQASLELMQQLTCQGGTNHLLLLGAYRDDEVSSNHPLKRMLANLEKMGTPHRTVSLHPLEMRDINQLVADALGCSLETARPLAELMYRIVEGNPFFNNQLLKSFCEEGLITFDSNSGHWQCDISKVERLPLPDDVMEFLSIQLRKLPARTQELLKLAACIGDSFDLATLAAARQSSRGEGASDLWSALQAGIILPQSEPATLIHGVSQSTDNTPDMDSAIFLYRFLHERVRQAAYSLIPEEQRKRTHLGIGRRLLKATPEGERKGKIFEIVNQFNRGLELVTERAERLELAALNLKAGREAIAAMSYRAAGEYFAAARRLLPADIWRSRYDLALSLHTSLAEAAYLNGDYAAVEELADIANKESRTPLDRVRIFEVLSQALAAQGKLAESMHADLQILESLGVTFPKEPSEKDVETALRETQSAYRQKGIEELIDLPLMRDPYQLAIARILVNMSANAYVTSPNLFYLLILKQVAISIGYGNTPASALGYALYGYYLCGDDENIESGCKFAQLALDLVQRLNAKEWQSRVISNVYLFVLHWKTRMRDIPAPFQSSYQTALESGDFQNAAHSAFHYCAISYFAGISKELPELHREAASFKESALRMKQMPVIQRFEMLLQAISDLNHGRLSTKYLTGDYYDAEVMLPRHLQDNDTPCLYMFYFHKLLLEYLFGEYKQAIDDGKQLRSYIGRARGFIYDPIICFYDSLSSLAAIREDPQIITEDLLLRIEANQELLKRLAQHAPMNYLHMCQLVAAERYRNSGEKIKAIDEYDQAIAGAKENGFLREEALANELIAAFFLDWGKEKAARVYMEEAVQCYARWGAKSKVVQLEHRYARLLVPSSSVRSRAGAVPGEPEIRQSEIGGVSDTSLDLATVVKASQAMAGEIELAPLLVKLVRIVIENAGAQRGALILEREGHWTVEAQGDTDGGAISVLQSIDLQKSETVSAEIVSHVVRTRASLVLDDAARSGDFSRDPYIVQHGVKSVICAPLINQGKLSGIVYLENNLATHAFTAERLELINLLSGQIALSLDNARLYQKAQEEIAERKMAEAALRESEERARTIFDSVNDAIIVHETTTGKILDVNQTACEMYGYSRKEFLQLGVGELTSDEQYSHLGARRVDRVDQEGPQIFEWKARGKAGREFWVEVSTRVAMIGGKSRVLVVVRDIEERKRMEAALHSSESVLRATMESISDGLLIISESQKVLHYNSRFMEIWSLSSDLMAEQADGALLNYVLPQLMEPDRFISRAQKIHAASIPTEDLLHFKDGRVVERFSYPLDRAGEEAATVWIFRDVTERRHAMEQIRRMNEELERRVAERTTALQVANKELEAFSYSVSHDLRTPLRAIDGYTRILLDEYAQHLDAEGLRFCNVIRSQTQRMGKLIDDLLAFSRFSRTGMNTMPVDMDKMVRMIFLELTTAEQRERIDFRVKTLLPAVGDPTLLHQIWTNLLSNAIKFSAGRERMAIEVDSKRDGKEIIYSIKDNGAGFDMQFADKLFGVFQRLHSESEFEGTGVGLAIVQRIIHRHEGRTWAEGETGKGATFYFSLPRKGE